MLPAKGPSGVSHAEPLPSRRFDLSLTKLGPTLQGFQSPVKQAESLGSLGEGGLEVTALLQPYPELLLNHESLV